MEDKLSEVIVEEEELITFVKSIFSKCGFDSNHAEVFADNLVDANLRGKGSHGVMRLPHYVERIESGGMETDPEVTKEQKGNTVTLVDGDGGPGQVTSYEAIKTGMEMAAKKGASVIGVINSNHFGTVSYYTNLAAKEDFIAIGVTHGGPIVTPYGGAEERLSTNPISIGAPHKEYPVNLDMSTSATALGNVFLAQSADREIPSEWIVNEEGQPTTDPSEFHALRPMAGYKGYGLAFMIDVLCGVLLSGTFGSAVSGLYDDISTPQELAHLFILIDVSVFTNIDEFKRRISALIDDVKQTPVRQSTDISQIRVPGEKSHEIKQRRTRNGIPIGSEVWNDLSNLADRFDVPRPETQKS